MHKEAGLRRMKIKTVMVFLISFFGVIGCAYYVYKNQEKEEKLQASYTAETTINRIESELNQYLAESHLIKNIVEDGGKLDEDNFNAISSYMQDEQNVIEAHELAKDGIVSQVYPLDGNEQAIGLNMLENAQRKKEATLAKNSGQYTIAGPFELVQGGTGSLLFDPIYTSSSDSEEKEFWGFSILVMNWQKFMEEVKIDKLEDAGYEYQIWKKDLDNEDKIVIAQSRAQLPENTLEVKCAVPNEVWYFEIIPKKGWITIRQLLLGILIALATAVIAASGYWQFQLRQYKDQIHATEIEKSAKAARQANEAKTRFLFNMSHDIRTPMNAIIGFSNLLEEHYKEPEMVRDYIGKIKSSSSVLLSLINYVLEMARIESGKATLKEETVQMEELKEILYAVFEPSVKEKKLTYNCKMDIKHKTVICDRTKTREILINIISNSVKYTPDGGKVTIKIKEIESEKEGYASYRFVVEDTGIGMSEEYLPHIFEEFTREHTSTESKVIGTGLGLPIVKSLVDLMGGTIKVESKVGKGTKFTIVLPFKISDDSLKEIEKDDSTAVIAENKNSIAKRILLAEDNDLNAEIAITILKEKGFEIDRAEDGKICVNMLTDMPAGYYDIVLMDIQMPNMNGYQAAQEIRKMDNSRSRIPIIAMTANAFDEDKKRAFDSGMDGYITKPIRVNELLAEIDKCSG